MTNCRFLFSIALIAFVFLSGCTSQQSAPPANTVTGGTEGTISTPPAGTGTGTQAPADSETGTGSETQTESTPSEFTVVDITPLGYVPAELTVAKGSTVTWTNNTDAPNWPASAVHPTHEAYPGSSRTKCGTAEENEIFDSCGMEPGESWSFTFNEVGEWGYHEHNEVKTFGKIIVIE